MIIDGVVVNSNLNHYRRVGNKHFFWIDVSRKSRIGYILHSVHYTYYSFYFHIIPFADHNGYRRSIGRGFYLQQPRGPIYLSRRNILLMYKKYK